MKYSGGMKTDYTLVIFALVAALGLVTVVAVDIILTAQQAEARGCRTSVAVNASKGRCFQPSTAELTAENQDEATIDDQVEDEEGEENESQDDQDEEEDDK